MTTTSTSRVAISGNTYPVRDQIKALGGRWDAGRRAWMVPADRADEARRLVASAPRGYVPSSSGGGRSSSSGRSRGTWTGCSCGSVEEYSRPSDCRQCRFDHDDN